MSDRIERLQQLFATLCNDEWEHGHGITIENLDNPGWSISIALSGTRFEGLEVAPRITERSEHDWLHVATKVKGHEKFLMSACGPNNLAEALDALLDALQ